jgi:hypothetical protein
MGALPEHENPEDEELEDVPEIEETEDDEAAELLNSEEMDRLERDAALQRAIASLLNGDHPSEATARLYAHGSSGNSIAQKWLNLPYDITRQVLEALDSLTATMQRRKANGQIETVEVDLVKRLGDDIVLFSQYVHDGGDPATWAKTGYTPKRRQVKSSELDPALRPTNPPPPNQEDEDEDDEDESEDEELDDDGSDETDSDDSGQEIEREEVENSGDSVKDSE